MVAGHPLKMDEKEYHKLYGQIGSYRSLDELAKKGHDRELLFVIYTNKVIRETKKRYYSVKKKMPELLMDWRLGTSFTEIAETLDFPAALATSLLLQQMGWSKKMVRRAMHDPSMIEQDRIKREVLEVIEADKIYTPEGNQVQADRGRRVEEMVGAWLDKKKRKYKTEKDSKAEGYPKTPDFRLEAPLKVNGNWVNWIECKGTFGDKVEISKDYRNQLTHYVDLFGAGMVAYWYGFLDGILTDERIIVRDKSFFGH